MASFPVPSEPETPHPQPMMVSASDINQLSARVAALENRLPENSWFFGRSFLKRVFAVWGHYFVAQLIIGIVLGAIFFACFLALAAVGLSRR